uniref:Uncharacterized protein n=1 Tax=Arundo donax TaxID=35708 RepID=A0A0A9EUG7_ARUDO
MMQGNLLRDGQALPHTSKKYNEAYVAWRCSISLSDTFKIRSSVYWSITSA